MQAANSVMTNYTHDIANLLTSVNGQAYTRDNNGNLLSDGTQTYTYDQANRLTRVSVQFCAQRTGRPLVAKCERKAGADVTRSARTGSGRDSVPKARWVKLSWRMRAIGA